MNNFISKKGGETMTKYKVINQFREKHHKDHIYNIGDIYPKQGERLNKERAEFLTKYNKQFNKIFLEEIKEVKQVKAKKEVGEE